MNDKNIKWMPFGSIFRGFEGKLTPENWKATAEEVYAWCKEKEDEAAIDDIPVSETTYTPETPSPIPFQECPVCKKVMLYQGETKKNEKAPDWICANPNCKYQWDNQLHKYVPGKFRTGVWNRQ